MSRIWRPWSSRRATAAVACVLALSGALAVGVAVRAQRSAPQPSAAAAGSVISTTVPATKPRIPGPATTAHPTTTAKPKAKGLSASPPTAVSIPSIGVATSLIQLGRNADGSVAVPQSFHVAGWYTGSVTPGQIGPTIILGHVDSKAGPGIFFRLGALEPGDKVTVNRADGKAVTFVITGVRSYLKNEFPTLSVYADTPIPTLRLITCGGAFDRSTGHYLSNIIAFGQAV
jgi:Sortase domain